MSAPVPLELAADVESAFSGSDDPAMRVLASVVALAEAMRRSQERYVRLRARALSEWAEHSVRLGFW